MSDPILTDPWRVIRDLYTACDPATTEKFPKFVTEHFKSHLQAPDVFAQVPVLDLKHPPESFSDGSVVVFHAMIQDTSISPELYLAFSENGVGGGWGLPDGGTNQTGDVRTSDLRECSVFWAVTIPGLSAWCFEGNPLSETSVAHCCMRPHKYPVPDAPHIGVQLKAISTSHGQIYDETLARPLRTTDLSSFVGILTSEPVQASLEQPTPSNVVTLHVLFSITIPSSVIPRLFPDSSLIPTIKSLREEIIQWIADEGLAGDRYAAEWVLLCAVARVRSRTPPVLPLSFTLAGFPPPLGDSSTTPTLHHVLSQLFPLVTTVPLSLNNLNNTSSCPESKDEDLHSGWLQHPKGSILLLTESAVTEGGIFNKGVMNIHSVQEMMRDQILDYIFPFSSFRFDTDCSFVIVTEGKKSTFFKACIQTNINVLLRPVLPVDRARQALYKSSDLISLPPPDKLSQFRRLVGGSKIGQVTIGESTGKHIEEDFLQERSTATKGAKGQGFTPDDLVQRVLVARQV
ncbi:unnamed protein product [Cyclocybe aegerita]|uniref:Uncharacterized protein n=1 Tax=Cyclocybe aegerita TaxID=1973307 RepID=A0A8S0X5Q8_CYCAE|nr:unnamed protein product [Cyclocybe aegerita]